MKEQTFVFGEPCGHGRHDGVGIRLYHFDQTALIRLACHDDRSVFTSFEQAADGSEIQACFRLGSTVALLTFLNQNRLDMRFPEIVGSPCQSDVFRRFLCGCRNLEQSRQAEAKGKGKPDGVGGEAFHGAHRGLKQNSEEGEFLTPR